MIEAECGLCGDTGWRGHVDGSDYFGLYSWLLEEVSPARIQWCTCLQGANKRAKYTIVLEEQRVQRARARMERTWDDAEVPLKFKGLDLATFEAMGRKYLAHKTRALAACKMWMAEGFVRLNDLPNYVKGTGLQEGEHVGYNNATTRYPGITFSGPPGRGKTAQMSVLFQHTIDNGGVGLWVQYGQLMARIQAEYSSREGEPSRWYEFVDAARKVPLLLIDDLGDPENQYAEKKDKRDKLELILQHRHANDLSTLITTNLSMDEIAFQFSERLRQRIEEMTLIVLMNGEVLRGVLDGK